MTGMDSLGGALNLENDPKYVKSPMPPTLVVSVVTQKYKLVDVTACTGMEGRERLSGPSVQNCCS